MKKRPFPFTGFSCSFLPPWRTFLSIISLAILLACAAGKEQASLPKKAATEKPSGSNNLVSVSGAAGPATGEQTKIVFEGSNNLFELIQNNAAYFDGSRELIVIKGNGNLIRFYHRSLLELNSEGRGSLILLGEGVNYFMCIGPEPPLNRTPGSVDTLHMENTPLQTAVYLPERQEESSSYLLIEGLLERIKQGEADAYYELAEVYNYGLENTPVSSEKAIALYEYGAQRGDILSIRRLGDLWFNGSFDKKANKAKGYFYYRIGTQLGDRYCQEMLMKK